MNQFSKYAYTCPLALLSPVPSSTRAETGQLLESEVKTPSRMVAHGYININ